MAKMVRIRVPEPFWTKVKEAAFDLYGYEGQEVVYLQGIMVGKTSKNPQKSVVAPAEKKIKKSNVEIESNNKRVIVYCPDIADRAAEVLYEPEEIEDFFNLSSDICDMFPEAKGCMAQMYIIEDQVHTEDIGAAAQVAAYRFKELQCKYKQAKRDALRVQIPDEVTERKLEGQPADAVPIEELGKERENAQSEDI